MQTLSNLENLQAQLLPRMDQKLDLIYGVLVSYSTLFDGASY